MHAVISSECFNVKKQGWLSIASYTTHYYLLTGMHTEKLDTAGFWLT